MSGEWDGLRAAAELLPDNAFEHEGDCGGTLCAGCGHCCHSIAKCDHACDRGGGCAAAIDTDELRFRRNVLAALDRLQAAEAAVERVQLVACEWDDLAAFMVGVGNKPGDDMQSRDLAELVRRANEVFAALDGKPSTIRERWALTPPPANSPQARATAPLSASGAESDHGGRGDGEGLG